MSADIPENFGVLGRIDPATVDVAARPRRQARNRPDPSPELREWEKGAEARVWKRPYPPNVMLEPVGFDKEEMTSPHSDPGLWALQLADAFGTRSNAVINLFLSQLQEMCGKGIWDEEAKQWRMSEVEFSAMLALVNAHRPKDEVQAMVAAQMVGLHILSMKVTARGIKYPHESRTVSNAARLAGATAELAETMQSLKGRKRTTRQSIKVTKETHIHAHRHDHHHGRASAGNSGQPHGRDDTPAAEIVDGRTSLRGEEPGRNVVSLPCVEGPDKMRPSRRQVTRSAEG